MAAISTALMAYGMSGKIFHAPFLATHEGFLLSAVVERHEKKAQKDYPGIKSYDNIDALLQDATIELVVVNTPNNLHFTHAKAALEAGKHILVEKPVCTTPEELDILFELADKNSVQILFYQNRRWDSDYCNLKSALNQYDFGHIHEAHFRFDRYNLKLSPKKFKEMPIAGSGIQYDLIPHVLDQAIALFGVPAKCYKRLCTLRPDSQVNDYCSLQLSYPDNLEVYVVASLVSGSQPPAFQLHGQRGSYEKMRSDVQEDQLKSGMKPVHPDFGKPPEGAAGIFTSRKEDAVLETTPVVENPSNYLQLFDAVYTSVRKGADFPVTRQQIRAQIQILAAAAD